MQIKQALFAALILGLGTGASAQVKPQHQTKFRKAGDSFMPWNTGKSKA